MIGNRLGLFVLGRTELAVDPAWGPSAAALIGMKGLLLFPSLAPGLPASTYWLLSIATTAALFATLLVMGLLQTLLVSRLRLQVQQMDLVFVGTAVTAAHGRRLLAIKHALVLAMTGAVLGFAFGVGILMALFQLAPSNVHLATAGLLFVAGFGAFVAGGTSLVPLFPNSAPSHLVGGILARWLGRIRAERAVRAICVVVALSLAALGIVAYVTDAPLGAFTALCASLIALNALLRCLTERREHAS